MDRYNSISSFLKKKFGCKVYKISLHAGLTCPNRDGSKGTGGCIYCNPESNRPFLSEGKTIKDQITEGIKYIKKRHKGTTKFISYFQHYSNTYGSAKELEKMYNDAISHKDAVGIAVSTRPDCIDKGIWKVLDRINKKTFTWLELGLQSSHNKTLKLINRGHSAKEFEDAVRHANLLEIPVCAHIILGLPGETRKEILETVELLARLNIWGVKIHNLHILRDTRLATMYEAGKVRPLKLEEYASLVADVIERLPKETIIHRVGGHSPRSLTLAPLWSINKMGMMNAVHKELERRDTYQGKSSDRY